jgi:ubiquinone/menaquinone biosynthesis C-methylase UbiE
MSSVDYHLHELSTISARDTYPDVSRARRILDVGCGIGQTILRLGGDLSRYVGVDVDMEAVHYGVSHYGLDLCVARGENLPYADASFDFLYSRVSVPYMDISVSLNEFSRVLEKDGVLWLSLHPLAFWRNELLKVRTPKALIYRFYVLLNGSLFHFTGRLVRFPLKRSRIESFQTQHSIRRALVKVGFRNLRLVDGSHQLIVSARR